MDFYIPDYLSTDFNDMLTSFGQSVTVNYNASTPTTNVKVMLTKKDSQSAYANIDDGAMTVRFGLTTNIKKGDYLSTTDNEIYIVTYKPEKQINGYKSQCQLTTTQLDFERWAEEILDETTGVQTTPAQYISVADNIACFIVKTGIGTFDTNVSSVGIVPQNKLILGLQYNSDTSDVCIGDEFSFRNKQYKIVDEDISQLNDSDVGGIIMFYAEKLEGGKRDSI